MDASQTLAALQAAAVQDVLALRGALGAVLGEIADEGAIEAKIG
jgi:hypothetical protein